MNRTIATPLERRHMPVDDAVSLAAYTRRGTANEVRIPEDYGPAQSLGGFEETYRNIIDYIVRITYRIWETRDVEYIRKTYSQDAQVFDDYGLQIGADKIVEDTYHTTGAFSDIQLIADEVVWAGDDEVGFHTSHRTIIRGTNDGPSRYGPATGRSVDVLVIANCVARENEIFLEHVLYNNSAMLAQLGFSLHDMAARLAADAPAGWPRSEAVWSALKHSTRPARPLLKSEPVEGFDVDLFEREVFDATWRRLGAARLDAFYQQDCQFWGPTNRAFHGSSALSACLRTLRMPFTGFEAEIDEVYWMQSGDGAYLTSTRWSADAMLCGVPIQIWGITQHEIVSGRIQREWMLFNELDLMMQIARLSI